MPRFVLTAAFCPHLSPTIGRFGPNLGRVVFLREPTAAGMGRRPVEVSTGVHEFVGDLICHIGGQDHAGETRENVVISEILATEHSQDRDHSSKNSIHGIHLATRSKERAEPDDTAHSPGHDSML